MDGQYGIVIFAMVLTALTEFVVTRNYAITAANSKDSIENQSGFTA
jgi:hypothetical protein